MTHGTAWEVLKDFHVGDRTALRQPLKRTVAFGFGEFCEAEAGEGCAPGGLMPYLGHE